MEDFCVQCKDHLTIKSEEFVIQARSSFLEHPKPMQNCCSRFRTWKIADASTPGIVVPSAKCCTVGILNFECSKRGWFANGPDFEWDLKSGQIAAILSKTNWMSRFQMVLYSNGQDHFRIYSDHLNTRLVWYLNGRFVSGCQMVWYSNGGLKTGLKKLAYGPNCPVFKWSANKPVHWNPRWYVFCSDLEGFSMAFGYQIIQNMNYFRPFK